MCQEMESTFQKSPDVFNPAIAAMIEGYNRIKSDTSLVSAMHSFGRYTGAARALKTGKLAGRVRHLRLSGSKHIGVQPTATARRRSHMGRGGARLHAGRPSKSSYTSEHSYSAKTPVSLSSATLPLPRRQRAPAPHSLNHVVTYNQALGKTHTVK